MESMKISLPPDCGNAPRMVLIGEFVENWAGGNADAVAGGLADDVRWTVIGKGTYTGPQSLEAAIPLSRPSRVEVHTIVTHGRLASCDGYLEKGASRVAFSHVFRFVSTSKTAKIAEIRTYMITTQ